MVLIKDIVLSICKYIGDDDHKSMILFEKFGVDLKYFTIKKKLPAILIDRTKFQIKNVICSNQQDLDIINGKSLKYLELKINNDNKISKLPELKNLKTLELNIESNLRELIQIKELRIGCLIITYFWGGFKLPNNLKCLIVESWSVSYSDKNNEIILPESLEIFIKTRNVYDPEYNMKNCNNLKIYCDYCEHDTDFIPKSVYCFIGDYANNNILDNIKFLKVSYQENNYLLNKIIYLEYNPISCHEIKDLIKLNKYNNGLKYLVLYCNNLEIKFPIENLPKSVEYICLGAIEFNIYKIPKNIKVIVTENILFANELKKYAKKTKQFQVFYRNDCKKSINLKNVCNNSYKLSQVTESTIENEIKKMFLGVKNNF